MTAKAIGPPMSTTIALTDSARAARAANGPGTATGRASSRHCFIDSVPLNASSARPCCGESAITVAIDDAFSRWCPWHRRRRSSRTATTGTSSRELASA